MPDDMRESHQAAPGRRPVATWDVIDAFRATLRARGIVPPDNVVANRQLHRCDAAGKNGKGDAAYAKYQHSTVLEHRPASHRAHLEWTPSRLMSGAPRSVCIPAR